MNPKILDRLRCPTCKGELDLEPFREESIERPGQGPKRGSERLVEEGVLLCPRCLVWYPVSSHVPVMLVFPTPFHRGFAERHAGQLRRQLGEGYHMPDREPREGERSVQETFTDEWDEVQRDDLSFSFTEDDLVELNREVWLKWLKEAGREEVRSVLDVGCGLGQESAALQRVVAGASAGEEETEVFGVDLNLALLESGAVYKERPGLHLIIASLFDLPFAESSFDLVYSEGVIHHTFSTKGAFRSIAPYVRPGGRLFVWVYGLDDHLIRRGAAGAATRTIYAVEAVARPLINRSPKGLRDAVIGSASIALHPLMRTRMRHKGKWKLNNTNHSLRDRMSPRYAHRHSYNEVLEWFEDLGFRVMDVQSPGAYRRLFKKQLGGVGVTGKKE